MGAVASLILSVFSAVRDVSDWKKDAIRLSAELKKLEGNNPEIKAQRDELHAAIVSNNAGLVIKLLSLGLSTPATYGLFGGGGAGGGAGVKGGTTLKGKNKMTKTLVNELRRAQKQLKELHPYSKFIAEIDRIIDDNNVSEALELLAMLHKRGDI